MDQSILIIGLGLAVVVVGALILRRETAARTVRRAGYLDICAPLFSDLVMALAPSGFPRLNGRYGGDLFDLQAVTDTLTYRKLPAFWLLVTLPQPLPVRGTLDVLLRPTGVESFTNFRNLPVQLALTPGFPRDCSIRTDAPGAMVPVDLVVAHLRELDPDRLKEIVVSPKGLRIVWLLEEAQRGRYLLFRDSEMGAEPLAMAQLRPLLEAAAALHRAIAADAAATERLSA